MTSPLCAVNSITGKFAARVKSLITAHARGGMLMYAAGKKLDRSEFLIHCTFLARDTDINLHDNAEYWLVKHMKLKFSLL